jgi:hypothetical protein
MDKHQDPINNSTPVGLEMGFRRPGFRREAPRWFTLLVFAVCIGLILAGLFLPVGPQ